MASNWWTLLLLSCLLATAVIADQSSEEEDDSGESSPLDLPFMVRKYEGTYAPAAEEGGDGQLTLTIDYVAAAPFEMKWAIGRHDIGMDFAALSGSRVWQYCTECPHGTYICSSTVQTTFMHASRVLSADLVYSSDSVVLHYNGFNSLVKNFSDATGPVHKIALAAPLEVYSHPDRQNFFNTGDDVVMRWEMASDNKHELAKIKRKHGDDFTEQDLYVHDDDELHIGTLTRNVDNIEVKITIEKRVGQMYKYTIEIKIVGATVDDKGAYVVSMAEGMENWVEVVPQLEESGYPSRPVMHLERRLMGSHFGIACVAEGHALEEIDLYFNNAPLVANENELVVKSSRTDDAKAVAYKATPTEAKPWADFSGSYECRVRQEDGSGTAIHEDWVFEEPAVYAGTGR